MRNPTITNGSLVIEQQSTKLMASNHQDMGWVLDADKKLFFTIENRWFNSRGSI